MRCAFVKTPGPDISNLVLGEREDPVPGPEQVRVRVEATALNRADLLQRRGLYAAPPESPADIPGLEFAGRIDRLGEGVTLWKGGERVMGVVGGGAYAERLVTHQRMVMPVPPGMGMEEAAAVPEAFMVAYDALVRQSGVQAGDLVLVHSATGGVGTAALQLGRAYGARLAGTSGDREKTGAVARRVPFFAVNYREQDFREEIEKAFGRQSVDIILDTVGGAYWERNLALLAVRGRLVLLGLMGGAKAETQLGTILFKRLRIMGSNLRHRSVPEKIELTQAFMRDVLPMLEKREVESVIDSVFTLDRIAEATERMEGNANTGKIVVTLP